MEWGHRVSVFCPTPTPVLFRWTKFCFEVRLWLAVVLGLDRGSGTKLWLCGKAMDLGPGCGFGVRLWIWG